MKAQHVNNSSADLVQRLTVQAKSIAEQRAKFRHKQISASHHIWRSARTLWPQFTVI